MKRYISILLILAVITGYAEETFRFRHITMADGLSDNQINHITRDSQGFMWFSTLHGLNRYDGYRFKIFAKSASHNDIPNSFIHNVQEDATGTLWIKHNPYNYTCYDPHKEVILDAEKVLAENYGITDKITYVYVDRKKDLWLHSDTKGTYRYCFSDNTLSLTPASTHIDKSGVQLTSMGEDHNGVLRIYSNGFFDHIDRMATACSDYENSFLANNAPSNEQYNIFTDRDGDYWIWSYKGIWVYYTHEKEWQQLNSNENSTYRLTGNHVKAIVNDREGRIWIGIDHGGINIIDKKRKTIKYLEHKSTDAQSLSQNNITSLYADPEGGIWVGTFKRGISYYSEDMLKFHTDKFVEFSNIKNFIPDVTAIAEDYNGNLCIGVTNGIITVDRTNKEKKLIPLPVSRNSFPDDVVLSIAPTADGRLWLGTYQSGLLLYNKGNITYFQLDPDNKDSNANKSIWNLSRDKSGYLWIGTWGNGLWRLDPESGHAIHFKDLDGNQIASLCNASDGNIYMATTYGLLIYYPITGKYEKLLGNRSGTQQFSNQCMSHIMEDSRGLIWISTLDGINIYNRINDKIDILNGDLGNSIINGVVEDNDKNIWISASDGIYHAMVSSGKTGYNYDIRKYSDIRITENQPYSPRAIIKTQSGKIALGGINGVSIINPDIIKHDTTAHKIVFTSLSLPDNDIIPDSIYNGNRILSRAINYTDEIRLRHDQNIFSVTFSSMNYLSSEKTGYMYKLNGFDSDWLYTTDNKLTYTNLAPGTYTLMVKTVNGNGISNGKTSSLKITITPPFHKSWIAYILYALLLAGIIMLIRAYMKHNAAQKYQLLQIQQEAKQKHELDDMKLRFFTNISHDLRTPLTLILTPLEYVIERTGDPATKSKLVMARNNAMRLLGMVNQLLDFRKSDMTGHTLNAAGGDIVETVKNLCDTFVEYSEQHNIALTFFSPIDKLYMMFDKDKIDKIVMNLLSNAFKFTPEMGRVDVSLDIIRCSGDTPDLLEIKVADNGCGISDEHKKHIFERFYQIQRNDSDQFVSGSGIGLNLVKEFATLHGGIVEVHDNIGKGSVFVVRIPIRQVITAQEDTKPNAVAQVSEEVDANPEQPADSHPDEDDTRSTILLVDDNDDFRMFIKDCLKGDYRIYDAPDGVKAWNMIPELQPDIIVSDVMMPEMDGNELCRRVKNDIRTSHILVILLTARAAKEHELKGLETGADDYITKPFNLNILTLRIKNLLQRRKNNRLQPMEISPSKINVTPLDRILIQKAIKYVEDNMSRSELSVEELSSELAMSRVHFYKKKMSITGRKPIEFIRIIRLKRAAQLLAESQLGIAEIAYQTGFNNLNLFRKYFKNEFGVLPSEYQSMHSKKYNETL